MINVTPDLFGTQAAGERISNLLYGADPRPRALSEVERKVLKQLNWHPGEANAIPIADLAPKLGLSVRQIKLAVRALIVEFELPIAGSRQEPYGYYMATTPAELENASRPLEGEVFAMLQRIRALRGPQYLSKLTEQLVDRLNNPQPDQEQRA